MAQKPFGIKVKLSKEFQTLGGFQKLGGTGARDVFQRGSLRAANILRATLVKGYENGVDKSLEGLHRFTIIKKGGMQPLFDTGRLAGAVELIVINRGSRIDYMVGFTRPDDASQARALEEGATITVTDKMRLYLAANGLPLKGTTKFLRIPARPIFLHSLKKAQKAMRNALQAELNKELTRNRLQAKGAGTLWARLSKRLSSAFG